MPNQDGHVNEYERGKAQDYARQAYDIQDYLVVEVYEGDDYKGAYEGEVDEGVERRAEPDEGKDGSRSTPHRGYLAENGALQDERARRYSSVWGHSDKTARGPAVGTARGRETMTCRAGSCRCRHSGNCRHGPEQMGISKDISGIRRTGW
jgi:hypothetical protein